MIGRTLSQYRIVERLGAGGMGEVWRAQDTTLGREAAIKVLPARFASDPERMARFEREAKLLASLNHPNIATVHGLHEADGVRFLAMELVPGQDLARRLARGPLPIAEALSVGRDVASALAAAHAGGVIHRDLKPANIAITPEGRVKVLDFGLAKALDPAPGAAAAPDQSPTMTSAGSVAGVILGTAAYMSPEQARGQPADRRSDIWAFGCVLYEMLVGKPPFEGATVSDTVAAILRAEPDWAALPGATSSAVRRLLRRCLAKDPERRLHDIADAGLEIDEAGEDSEAEPRVETGPRGRGRVLPWVVAGILAVIAAFAVFTSSRPRAPGAREVLHLAVMLPESLDLAEGNGLSIMGISPDAKRLVVTVRRDDTIRLCLRALDAPDVVEIPGTEAASAPFFSPDGRWVAFFAGGKLEKVAVQGGTPIVLCDAPTPRGGTWVNDDTIVFAPAFTSGLAAVSTAGGEPRLLTKPDAAKNERTHRWPAVLPGGKSVLFTIGTLDKPGDYEDAVIAVLDLESGEIRKVVVGASMAVFAPSGHVIYAREGTLIAMPFDPARRAVTGPPATVLKGVAGDRTSGVVHFALARDGTLVYVPIGTESMDGELAWVYRDGRIEVLPAERRLYRNPSLSPDGKRLALNIGPGPGDNDAWIYDFDRDALTRLTFDKATFRPMWTPDGKHIVYASTIGGHEGLAWKAADGSADPRMILPQSGIYTPRPSAWVPGRNELVFSRLGGNGGSDVLSIVPGEAEPKAVLDGPSSEGGASFSPDGKWMAYSSDESGRLEVYVRAYPGPGGKWQISTNGGRGPCWSRDGREIFYTLGRRMMAVPVATDPSFAPGQPRQLFEFPFERFIGPDRDYDVAPDGRRFIFVRQLRHDPRQIDLILGFSAGASR